MAQPVRHPELGEIRIVASPLQFVGASRAIRLPTPDPGQHTDEILRDMGYDQAQIENLRKCGAIL
jgi:crotonobetainyl-CoA:carnitine CoA-transferase CaiB-like acyl-CoA transferase